MINCHAFCCCLIFELHSAGVGGRCAELVDHELLLAGDSLDVSHCVLKVRLIVLE
jgi:hypothetical protein